MQIITSTEKFESLRSDALLLPLFEEGDLPVSLRPLDKSLNGIIAQAQVSDFKGESGETLLLIVPGSHKRILLIGLGNKKELDQNRIREAFSASAALIKKSKAKNVFVFLSPVITKTITVDEASQAISESLLLSLYAFDEYKSKPKDHERKFEPNNLSFIVASKAEATRVQKAASRGQIIATAVAYARELSNHPGNVMTPERLAGAALELAKTHKLKSKILEKSEMERLGMNAILAVNQGSELPPKFIILEHRGKGGASIVLVGKGITFDSGGISIKPSEKMDEMKFDMCGAATVLGIMQAVSELKIPHRLIALIPATENLPSGSAMRPGDIVKALNDKTIEVNNTDAEGRMILADALSYAKRYKPKMVIDFATLTGAVISALGMEYAGSFTNDQKLDTKLKLASAASGERVWQLPLAPEYKEKIKSEIADVHNTGRMEGGGAIKAALFLEEFVDFPWIHLDIAGVAWTNEPKPYRPKGATGFGVRLMMEFLK